MSIKGNPFSFNNRTIDGIVLVSGCFRAKDEFGLPIDVIYEICSQNGLLIDWADYIEQAEKQGKIKSALKDMEYTIGKEKMDEFLKTKERYAKNINIEPKLELSNALSK